MNMASKSEDNKSGQKDQVRREGVLPDGSGIPDFVVQQFRDARHGVFLSDFDGRLQFANRALLKQLGLQKEGFAGVNMTDLVDPSHRRHFQSMCTDVRKSGALTSFLELALIRKDGQKRWLALEGLKLDGDRHPALLLGIAHDLTEKQAELDRLRSREAGYRTLINASLNAAFLIDLEGTILVANERGANRLGHTPAGIVGRNFDELLPPDIVERRKQAGIRAVLEGRVTQLEDRDHSGAVFRHQFFPVVGEDGEIKHLAIYSVDITEQRASEEERERLQAQLQQAQKMEAIGTLAGGIAHDFNNLMMAIQGNVSLALMNMEPDDIRYESLKNIEKNIRSGADLTAKLLGYARKGKYEIKPLNLNLLVTEISDTFGRMRKDISVDRDLADDLSGILADKGQLEQVLFNLFVNSADAMPDGGNLTVKTRNVTGEDISTDKYRAKPGSYVQLTVTDTGTGISPKVKERIFDPFFTTKKMGRGTGLGLASAYGIVKSHKGYIEAESPPGQGATFYIYLPASRQTPRELPEELPGRTNGHGTLLLVDDEENVLTVTSQMLTRSGYTVIEAQSGREAIEIYSHEREKIDLIILDMVMPEMGGGEIFDLIKSINPSARVLLASGYSLEGKAREIMKRGCDGFIQKPFLLKELISKVQAIIDRPR